MKKKQCFLLVCFLAVITLTLSTNSFAQIFSDQPDNAANSSNSNNLNNRNWLANPRRVPAKTNNPTNDTSSNDNLKKESPVNTTNSRVQNKPEAKKTDPAKPNPYISQPLRPTLDGVKRGHTSIEPVRLDVKDPVDDRYIFVYQTNFKIMTTMSGKVMCNVRFIVMSTLDRKINNISFRLKWPAMETAISFNDVTPNIDTYIDYTLLGDGCYSMDRTPNIIVNRCRVREMSQQECANKIKWLRKSM